MKKSLADMCIDHALGRDREKEMEEDRRREAKPLIRAAKPFVYPPLTAGEVEKIGKLLRVNRNK